MILLDTNVLSELMKAVPHAGVIAWIDSRPATEYAFSAVTKAEIELGLALLPDGKRKTALKQAAGLMFEEFPHPCLSFNCDAATRYAQIVADRTRIGRPISVEDAQIAAIALVHNMAVATRNTDDFALITELTVINPWKS